MRYVRRRGKTKHECEQSNTQSIILQLLIGRYFDLGIQLNYRSLTPHTAIMSDAKLQAARELIQEERYAEARILLRTLDHPTAHKWLARIETIIGPELPPPPPPERARVHARPSAVEERFYRRENSRSRLRDIWSGFVLLFLAFIMFGTYYVFMLPRPSLGPSPTPSSDSLLNGLMLLVGVMAGLAGLYRIFKRE